MQMLLTGNKQEPAGCAQELTFAAASLHLWQDNLNDLGQYHILRQADF